jgi:hypothetical protein
MRFELVQRYASSPDEVHRAYADPALYPSLTGLPKLGDIAVVDHRGDPVDQLRIRFHFTGHLPAAVTAVVDPARLSWVQDTTVDHAARRASFRMVPDHYPDRLRSHGIATVTADPTGARRTVAGELTVQALLVAGRVERAIVSGLEEYLAAEAPVVDEWIRSRR